MLPKENYNGILDDIADTNSMDPWIDAGHQALMVPIRDKAPFRVKDLIAGDIIMFTRSSMEPKMSSIGSSLLTKLAWSSQRRQHPLS